MLCAHGSTQICAWQEVSPALRPPSLNPEVSPADEWHLQPRAFCAHASLHTWMSACFAHISHTASSTGQYILAICVPWTHRTALLTYKPGIPWVLLALCGLLNSSFGGHLQARLQWAPMDTALRCALRWVFRWLRSEAQISWAGALTLCLGLLI